MKRTAALPIALATVVGLAACGSGGQGPSTTTDAPPAKQARRAPSRPAPAPTTPASPAAPSGTTAADPAGATGGTTVSGTGYRFSLTSPGWSDDKAAVSGSGVAYDRIYTHASPGGGRRVIETMRREIPAADAGSPDVFRQLLKGMRSEARTGGMTLGTPTRTTLGGERALAVPAVGRSSSGRRFAAQFVLTVHGSTVYSVAMVGPDADRAAMASQMEHVRRSWTFTDAAAPTPRSATPDATTPETTTPQAEVPAWRPGIRRA